jgi:hypothetical protein
VLALFETLGPGEILIVLAVPVIVVVLVIRAIRRK